MGLGLWRPPGRGDAAGRALLQDGSEPMVAWSDVCRWNPEPLAQAAESLGRASGALTSIRGEAQSARTRVISEAPSVTAARGAQGRCEARHGELIGRVRGMHRATWDACDGVEMVRRSVLACQDYAAEHPAVVLHDDGSVSASPEAKASGSGGASVGGESGGSSDSAAAEAAKVAGQVAELQAMVSATLAQANQVDQSYAAALTMVMAADKSGDPPNSNQPARTRDTRDRSSAGRAGQRTGRSNAGREKRKDGDKPDNQGQGLHDPVAGEHAEMPGVKPWQYGGDSKNEGSGEYGREKPTAKDHAVHQAASMFATACAPFWPDASKNLQHFLGNTGDPQPIDVDGMLNDLPELKNHSKKEVENLAKQAVEDAKNAGMTEPHTYPFDSSWDGMDIDKSANPNWYYATGKYQTATDGTITVYPPKDGSSTWTYKYNYRTHVADRYNWDGGKSTNIFGFRIEDKQLQRLHTVGLAKEYDLSGESSIESGSGEVEVK